MAKIVIAGSADCPYYAKVEILADSLQENLPDFNLHKIVKPPQDWEAWLLGVCSERGWTHTTSPIVWRELINRGGKGIFIGGANELQEYANVYYGVKSDFTSDDMRRIAEENLKTKAEIDQEEAELRNLSKPINVCITNAKSLTCYNMISSIALGAALGPKTEVALHVYDTDALATLEGLEMEAEDLACGLLRSVTVTGDVTKAFKDASVVILLDEITRYENDTDDDYLKTNSKVFASYGKVLNEVAKKDVKVILGGYGPLNLNTYVLIQNAPSIPKENIVALSRVLENQAKAIIATRLNVNSAGVVDVVIWGNTSGTYIADVSKARVHGYEGAIMGPDSYSVPVREMVHDDKWLATEFVESLRKRREAIEAPLGHPAGVSHAAAMVTMLNHWWSGSPEGQIFSLCVTSDGQYGVPAGLVVSFPVKIDHKGHWEVVSDLDLDDEKKEKMTNIINELMIEKEVIYPDPNKPQVKITPQTPCIPEEDDSGKKVFGDAGETQELVVQAEGATE